MKLRLFPVFTLTVAMLAAPVLAHEYHLGDITIGHPWSRPTPPGTPVGVGYMTIHNQGDQPVTLTAGETPVADRVSIHETVQTDGVMKMQPLPGGLTVPAGGSVELKPHSFHLMLESLNRPLEEGERVPLTLEFGDQQTVGVELQVEQKDDMHGSSDDSDHSHHSHQ